MKQLKPGFNKALLTLLMALLSAFSYSQYDSIPFDGYNRTYLLHLPSGYPGTEPLPMVVAMHGGFGNAYNMENQSLLSNKADIENFIVVYPEGIKGGLLNVSSWNAGWCCGYASSSDVDDVGFIDALLDTLIVKHAIDTNRIYATGMSNGGFMAYRLGNELSHRIAAIAPVAASMSISILNPARPVPIIDFHSYLDTSIPYEGGIGDGPSDHYNTPKDSVLNIWAAKNSCAVLNDTLTDNSQYTFIKWSGCNCGAEIHHYVTQDGGHSWPGGIQTLVGDPSSVYINATDLMWSFFQQYSLDCNNTTDIIESSVCGSDFTLFPSPTKETLIIYSETEYQELEISVYSSQGKKILTVKNQAEIDISHLTSGYYFVRIKTERITQTEQILKI